MSDYNAAYDEGVKACEDGFFGKHQSLLAPRPASCIFAPDSAVADMLPAGLVKGRPQRVAA